MDTISWKEKERLNSESALGRFRDNRRPSHSSYKRHALVLLPLLFLYPSFRYVYATRLVSTEWIGRAGAIVFTRNDLPAWEIQPPLIDFFFLPDKYNFIRLEGRIIAGQGQRERKSESGKYKSRRQFQLRVFFFNSTPSVRPSRRKRRKIGKVSSRWHARLRKRQ